MTISLLVQLCFIFLLTPTNVISHAHQTQCLDHEKNLLLQLRNQLVFNSSHSTKLVRWNQTDDECCRWKGVKCDGEGHVISLQLDDEAISGGFNESSSLFSLEYLEELSLAHNFLSGSLPDSLSNLKRLYRLHLSDCKFSGAIPSVLSNLTRLEWLDLSHNFFSGSISSFHFQPPPNVDWLDLSYNSLSGNIPTSIFTTLPKLWLLNLNNNQFSGQVSELPIQNISRQLYSLDLSNNRLESPIPNSFFNIQSLGVLSLSDNLFNESFQLEKIVSLPRLYHLDLSSNSLSLDAPTNLPAAALRSSLEHLILSDNKIEGEFPSWIWENGDASLSALDLSRNMLVGLQKPINVSDYRSTLSLELHSNQLQGELSSILQIDTNCNLLSLDLSDNNLVGDIPLSLANCTQLNVVDLSNNTLSGTVPTNLTQLKDLVVLNLGRNNFTGPIPNFAAHCPLQYLILNNNNFIGELPQSLENCKQLEAMNVGGNHIEDTFPCMLPSSLRLLVLRSNRFHGGITCKNKSWPNLQIIDVASNNFSGYLNPFNFSTWRGMTRDTVTKLSYENLDFKETKRAGYYYTEEVNLIIKGVEQRLVKIKPDFTSIDFSSNDFQGGIPDSIAKLDALYLLNLSHNSLSGTIPKSFSNLTWLGALDLSVNWLTGEIPKEIAGLTFLQLMNVSHNKLVGKIPVGTQMQTFPADCFEGNAGLCGLPLNISCSDTSSPSLPNLGNVESETDEIEWAYVFTAAGYAVGLGSFSWLLLFCRSFRYKYFEKIEEVFYKILNHREHKKRKDRLRRRAERNRVRREGQ